MVRMRTLQSDGHIIVFRRLLHKPFRSFPSLLSLWQEMGKEFGSWKTCGGGTNLWDPNIQDYLEQSRIKIFLFLQFSVLLVPSLKTLIFTATYPILRQKIQKVSCGHLIVCICHLWFQMRDPGLYLLQGFFTVKSFFLALSQCSSSPPIFPTKFVWNSQVPFKVKSFVQLVAHKKEIINDLLQLKRPYKAFSPDICKLCMRHEELVDHLFLYCYLMMGL